ncbi:MAG: hypothetical protein K2Q15_11250 [Burkholderiales bacterium]|nr:hypothetical protein [Burkholderiales bacterium]
MIKKQNPHGKSIKGGHRTGWFYFLAQKQKHHTKQNIRKPMRTPQNKQQQERKQPQPIPPIKALKVMSRSHFNPTI